MNEKSEPVPVPESLCGQPFLCPLNQVRTGTSVRIKRLAAAPEVTHRLRELGFCEEQKIKLLSGHAHVICQVCDARLGLSAQLAGTILVEPLTAPPQAAEDLCPAKASR